MVPREMAASSGPVRFLGLCLPSVPVEDLVSGEDPAAVRQPADHGGLEGLVALPVEGLLVADGIGQDREGELGGARAVVAPLEAARGRIARRPRTRTVWLMIAFGSKSDSTMSGPVLRTKLHADGLLRVRSSWLDEALAHALALNLLPAKATHAREDEHVPRHSWSGHQH